MVVDLTSRAWWTTVHGVVLGGLLILSLGLVVLALSQLREESFTEEGLRRTLARLRLGMLGIVVVAWLAVILGTFVVDPWFHAHVPGSPLTILEARPHLVFWTDLVMEWKERISWISALVASVAAYLTWYYGDQLAWDRAARRLVVGAVSFAFVAAAAGGVMGLLLSKVTPVV
jgi:hypothetical protein